MLSLTRQRHYSHIILLLTHLLKYSRRLNDTKIFKTLGQAQNHYKKWRMKLYDLRFQATENAFRQAKENLVVTIPSRLRQCPDRLNNSYQQRSKTNGTK